MVPGLKYSDISLLPQLMGAGHPGRAAHDPVAVLTCCMTAGVDKQHDLSIHQHSNCCCAQGLDQCSAGSTAALPYTGRTGKKSSELTGSPGQSLTLWILFIHKPGKPSWLPVKPYLCGNSLKHPSALLLCISVPGGVCWYLRTNMHRNSSKQMSIWIRLIYFCMCRCLLTLLFQPEWYTTGYGLGKQEKAFIYF